MQNQEFIQEFIEEAKMHLEKIESSLIKLDQLITDVDLVNEVFRSIHSIKGTAGFFGLKNIVALSHAMENVFSELRSGKIKISENIIDIMLRSNDALKDMIEDVLNSDNYDVNELVSLLNDIHKEIKSSCKEDKKNCIRVIDKNNTELYVCDPAKQTLETGIKHGHHVYEINFKLNQGFLYHPEGTINLLNKIKTVATIVGTFSDHSGIITTEDLLEALKREMNGITLALIVTTVLDREMLAEATDLEIGCIDEVKVDSKEQSFEGYNNSNALKPLEVNLDEVLVKELKSPDNKEPVEKKPVENKGSKADSNKSDDIIRVNVQILNDLLNLASELVLGRNQLLRTLDDYKKSIPGLVTILQNIDHLTSSLQEKIMRTRMQPVGNVFNKFPRIIRDISKSVNKEIDLQIEGSEVELDKSMIEALADPLTHLVRNAADHGLESPEKREALNKDRVGTIKLKAYHEGGFVNIDVSDNGAGIDIEKLKERAIEKKILSQDEAVKLKEQDALKLIFKPGFSTKETITDISGRGVGMDVVKTNVEKLGGSIEIFTTLGKGTTIRLVIPLTLAIIQSLIVESNGQRYALPQVNMQEIVRVKEGEQTRKIENINGADVIHLRGSLLPIVHLTDIFKISKEDAQPNNDNVSIIIVLKIGMIRFGIAVDSIIGSEETLVKPLPKALKECIFYSGVTIMGDGKPAMILDPDGIIKEANLELRIQNIEVEEKHAKENIKVDAEIQDLLLFKCSGAEKFAIDMNMVARVEEVDSKNIQRAGEREFLKLKDHYIRIIRLEDYLPVETSENSNNQMYVIIPKLVPRPIGILVNQIVDNVRINVNLNTEDTKAKGILGTSMYNGDIIVFLQLYELFELADPELNFPKKVVNNNKILLAEDTPFYQSVLMNYLISAGYEVTLTKNGKEAWDLMSSKSFDLILSDLYMPVMDGTELARRIRGHDDLNNLPIVALSSMIDDSNQQSYIDTGFEFCVYKLDRDKLLCVLEQALKRKGGGED